MSTPDDPYGPADDHAGDADARPQGTTSGPLPGASGMVVVTASIAHPRINFACEQNDVPLLHRVAVQNTSSLALQGLTIRISSEPDFVEACDLHVDRLPPGGMVDFDVVDLRLSPRYLLELNERAAGLLWVEAATAGGVLSRESHRIELLAHDEWDRTGPLEMLAAFVQPNDPAVEPTLNRAARILDGWTHDPSLAGYQAGDPRRVFHIAAATFGALQDLDITYINPPASFEDTGQKVRTPSRISEHRLGTCLDLAVYGAALLEQCGLNPIVVLVKGHAFAGVWLSDESFPDTIIDDAARLRTRVQLGEVLVFDLTEATRRPRVGFAHAVDAARRALDMDEAFHAAIDIHRARIERIRPLPTRHAGAGPAAVATADAASAGTGDLTAPAVPPEIEAPPKAPPPARTETPHGRLDRWKRKLLDLTRHNRLLHYRESKTTLPLLCPDLGMLEDRLARGLALRIEPRPPMMEGSARDLQAHLRRTGVDPAIALLQQDLEQQRLHAALTPEDTDRRLLELYRATRTDLDESGANTLYLVLGFLRWFEDAQSRDERIAPILLVPIHLDRVSVKEGYRLRLGDDEARVNVTLIELLAHDFGIRVDVDDPLPLDDHGVDVAVVLRAFRTAICNLPRWDVVEWAHVARLSFAKFLLWRDLELRTDLLLQNRVVDHLVNRPDQPFDPGGSFLDADKLDELRPAGDTLCPCDADSSQLAAVFAASEGRSFVLEGPPGTGKSQTITNIIAQCLSEGRTVLFVAEKSAALNVVKARLDRVGLGDVCLELHSNKSRKREVLDQLGRALRTARERHPDEWALAAARAGELRAQLNMYVDALHRPRSIGESVYQGIDRLIGLRAAPLVPLRWATPDAVDAAQLARLRDTARELAATGGDVGSPGAHPWVAARTQEWSQTWVRDVAHAVDRLSEAVAATQAALAAAEGLLGFEAGGGTLDRVLLAAEVAAHLVASPRPHRGALLDEAWPQLSPEAAEWIACGRRRDALQGLVTAQYRGSALALPLADLQQDLGRAGRSWFFRAWWLRRRVRRTLGTATRDGRVPPADRLAADVQVLSDLKREQSALGAAEHQARHLFGRQWKGGDADWDLLESQRAWLDAAHALAHRVAAAEGGARVRECWAAVTTDTGILEPAGDPRLAALNRLVEALAQLRSAREGVVQLLDLDEALAWGGTSTPGGLGRMQATMGTWRPRLRELKDWCAWRRIRAAAIAGGLDPLVAAFENNRVHSEDLEQTFERSFYQWWVESVVDGEAVLCHFRSADHARRIGEFRTLDAALIELATRVVQARLAERVPPPTEGGAANSEVGILQRELQKQRRHLPVRRLIERIPHLLPRLTPCLLMSPLSVTQYLDARTPLFDVVVFDEASQIPVWDAVGAIARGRSVIIVGDSKQLPPTNFFSRAEDDEVAEDEAAIVDDLESILDDCVAARLPRLNLKWHYRSRHESLIAFSNHHYYQGRLLTFPSALFEGLGVQWRPVADGVYDKGRTRTNRAEAVAIVAEIVRRLRDSAMRSLSIGVVTFAMSQQRLIEDLLDDECRRDPSLEPFFSDAVAEPVFVKNLENVQGDERDIILFSICYGPDAAGKVAMNFGPLNRDGGERRLNVAVTRARREVLVFSTLRADQLDLSRTRAVGAAHLKSFLEYAERGPGVLGRQAGTIDDGECESPFEQAVYDALREHRWVVHRQVGCSGYRIDLAVVDPDLPGRYLLGIECDGANYHSAKTARDRDRLRAQVLESLGWCLHRIWSTDWWADAAAEIEKVHAALKSARARTPREQAPGRGSPEATAAPVANGDDQPGGGRMHPVAPPRRQAPSLPSLPAWPPQSTPLVAGQSVPAAAVAERPETYEAAPGGEGVGTPNDFFAPMNRALREALEGVVRSEGPISLGLATRRVARMWRIGRVSQRALDHVAGAIRSIRSIHVDRGQETAFLWPEGLGPDTYRRFRVPGSDPESERQPADVHPVEIANAIRYVLERHVSLPRADLLRETARLLGYQRTGRIVQDRMAAGLAVLIRSGVAREDPEPPRMVVLVRST